MGATDGGKLATDLVALNLLYQHSWIVPLTRPDLTEPFLQSNKLLSFYSFCYNQIIHNDHCTALKLSQSAELNFFWLGCVRL